MGIVYCLTNVTNDKKYIGISFYDKRLEDHIRRSKLEKPTQLIDKKIKQYGVRSFVFEIIERCDNELLKEKEKYYISKYDTIVMNKKGYNLTWGGDSNSMDSEICRQNHLKNVKRQEEHYNFNKKLSNDIKQKIKIKMVDVRKNSVNPFTNEKVRKKISELAKLKVGELNPNFKYKIDKDILYDYYIIKNNNLKDTYKHFNCSEATMIRNLRKYGISKKNISK